MSTPIERMSSRSGQPAAGVEENLNRDLREGREFAVARQEDLAGT
jgi:hypothetical protein